MFAADSGGEPPCPGGEGRGERAAAAGEAATRQTSVGGGQWRHSHRAGVRDAP